ncbi:MAG: hypothetical protein FJX75_17495 [Armatimonadetes bacterium]|nr:hypothetical protein [Armatimonadota bacterium]
MTHSLNSLIKRMLTLVALVAAVFAVGCVSGAQDRDSDAPEARLSELQQDIDLLQEFNRLQLSKEQLQALIVQVDAVHQAMGARKVLRADILNRLQALLEEQRTALVKDQPAPPAVCEQIKLQTEKLQEFDQATTNELLRFAEPVKAILTPDQIDILTWVSEARLQAAESLEWARTMSADQFKTDAEVNAEGLAENRAITKEEILDIYRTVRAMGEDEWEQAKDTLAEKLVPAFRDDSAPIDLVLIQRLQPDRVPVVLKEKLAQMK